MPNIGLSTSAITSSLTQQAGGTTGVVDVTKQTANPVLPGNTAAVNSTNIAAIIAAATTGQTIYFPPGTYQFASTINVGTKSFKFVGAGSGQAGAPAVVYTILCTTSATADLFALTDTYWYTEFSDICFSTTVTKTAGAMINTGTASSSGNVGTHIRRCNFNGSTQGSFNLFNCVVFNGTNSANQTMVEDCYFENFASFGISLVNNTTTNSTSSSLVVSGCTMQGQLSSGNALAGIQVTQCGAVQIDNCDIIGCVNNLLCNPATGSPAQGVFSLYCTNTYFDNSFGSCIKLTGTGNIERSKFEQCSFTVTGGSTGYSAVEISSTATILPTGIDFVNCNVYNTFGNTGTSNGFLINGCQDINILGCRIAGWTNGINITPSTGVVTKPNIQGCIIGSSGNIGVNTVGILLNAGSFAYGSIQIQNNNLVGNTTPITDSSTITVTALANVQRLINNNLGYQVASGRGVVTPTVPATTVAVFNPNGVTCSVWIIAGTLTVVKVGGINTPYVAAIASPGIPVRVGANESLAVTFSVAPTWTWVPEG
jgi:hypothetical protein